MTRALLKIRTIQAGRAINDLGIGRFVFALLMLSGIVLLSFMAIQYKNGAWFTGISLLLIILTLHIKRKDLPFLRIHTENYRVLPAIEYILISLPVIAGFLYWQRYIEMAVFLALLVSVVFIGKRTKKRTLNTWFQKLIPDLCFEWKSGIRSSLLYLIPLYLIGLAGSGWPGTVPVVMIVLGMTAIGFTEKNEPLPMLLSFELSANRLILLKILNQVELYIVIVLPLVVAFMIQNQEFWYLVVAFFILNILVQIYAILCKYAFYQPHTNTGNQVFNILGSVSILIPFLIPLVLILGIRFYFKSVSNLNQYLHDYN